VSSAPRTLVTPLYVHVLECLSPVFVVGLDPLQFVDDCCIARYAMICMCFWIWKFRKGDGEDFWLVLTM